MEINSREARIEGTTVTGTERAFIDVDAILSGYVPRLRFYPETFGHFVLASRKESTIPTLFLIALPSKEWEQDLIDDGYTIEQVLVAKKAEEMEVSA